MYRPCTNFFLISGSILKSVCKSCSKIRNVEITKKYLFVPKWIYSAGRSLLGFDSCFSQWDKIPNMVAKFGLNFETVSFQVSNEFPCFLSYTQNSSRFNLKAKLSFQFGPKTSGTSLSTCKCEFGSHVILNTNGLFWESFGLTFWDYEVEQNVFEMPPRGSLFNSGL